MLLDKGRGGKKLHGLTKLSQDGEQSPNGWTIYKGVKTGRVNTSDQDE
jgi:hypothetical protein